MNARIATLVAAAALAMRAFAQCPAEGDCREVHETPGCIMPECCALVCEANPLCCEVTWDLACVKAAEELCEGINCPAAGSCTVPHDGPGCEDYECCDFISSLDPWCEGVQWDATCAREASAWCGIPKCELSLPAVADENEPCYERFNDGCATPLSIGRIALACGGAVRGKISDGGPRDTEWFALDGAAPRRFRVTVHAEFPAELSLVTGGCEGPNETRWLVGETPCGTPKSLVFIVPAGEASFVLGAGGDDRAIRNSLDCDEIDPEFPPGPKDPPPFQAYGLRWTATLECLALADVNADGLVNAADLALVLGAWGPRDQGLPFDPRVPDSDLNDDGQVNAADLSLVLGGW
ncbi:MAG: dockerin type I domain-containing protein [Phycisphaerales bacterium]